MKTIIHIILAVSTSLVLASALISIAGDLAIGPYSGRVVDAETGEPVEKASVMLFWGKIIIDSQSQKTQLINVQLTSTDKSGNYKVERFLADWNPSNILESTHFIVYQPGYQAHIVTVYHNDPYSSGGMEKFKKTDNVVRLIRIPPDFTHKMHYDNLEFALKSMQDYDETAVDQNLKRALATEDLLRRAEWEERRGRAEK